MGEALGEASGKPVQKVMSTWTEKMGYPVLDVTCKSRTDDFITLSISQCKFCASGKRPEDEEKYQWAIPISFSTSASPHHPVKTVLMEDKTIEVTIDNVPQDGWVKLNPGTYGFYRTKYSSDLLNALLPAVKDQSLPARDRLGLQTDLFALVSSGLASTTDFLVMLQAYSQEPNYTVWSDLNAKIGVLNNLLWNYDVAHAKFKKFTLNLFKPTADAIGWDPKEGEGHLDGLLRSLVIGRMGSCGDEATIEECRRRLQAHSATPSTPLNADLRAPVYGNVLANGGKDELDTLLTLHKETDLHEERNRVERSLGKAKDPALLKEVLEFSMSDRVRSNDRPFVIGSVAGCSPLGRDMAWEFTKTNWDKLHEVYKGMFLMSRLVKLTTEPFGTEEKAQEIEEFFSKNPAAAAERTIQQSIEQIRQKSSWWDRDGEAIGKWLSENV